jgi:N-acetylmuramoyl-L-alanine amidase
VISERLRKIGIVHHVSTFLTLSTGLVLLLGCQTGLQRPVPIRTEVLAPEMQIAPAASVEVPPVAAAAPASALPPTSSVQSPWPANWSNTWVSVQSWGKFNDSTTFTRNGDPAYPTFRVQTPSGIFLLKIGSRVAEYDGLECWLGFAPQLIGGSPYVHWLDAQKTLQPLARPGSYCCDNGRTIVLDAGHGGRDIGTTGISGTRYEKDYTLDWALRLQRLLSTNGWNVVMTRTTDVDLDLSERVAIADQVNADFFLSLHFNSGSANRDLAGVETYCLTPTGMPSHLTRTYEDDVRHAFPNNKFDEQNLQAAVRLHRVLLQASGAQDRGVRRARFMTVLRGQNRPAVLVEGGYLSNPTEAQRIASASYRQILAEAVARGLQIAQ